ncbi:uncharacterized protein LOC111995103 [Quercus suber]|uniref:Transmembrane protein n=1 Tax=Quercus suber TaxID=58331 RepID=A0AAW0LB50_QUESU|nr:uncharacterized protein LOC111995103 [Quercus suber]
MDSLKGRVIINESKSKKKNFNNKKYSNVNNTTTTTTKKKKFLLCFKPMTMDGLEEDPVFKYFAVEEKEGMLFPVISKPSMAPDKKEAQVEEEEKGSGRRKKGRNVKLSKFLKAVFTGTFLAKKLKKRKLVESSFRSETIITEKGVKTMNSVNKDSLKQDDDNLRINSNVSSCSRRSSAFTATPMCSSSSSSSSTSNSRSMSQRCNSFESTLTGANSQNEQDNNGSKQRQDKNNNVQKHEKRNRGFYIGFCLPLICLLVLIFWGKIFAILCTSMGFFMVRWSSRCALPEDGIKSSEFDSDEHKKKVIMEGLLKRGRAHEL